MIHIVTDSTCDLPQPFIDQYQISVLPHFVVWGSEQFRDRIDLQPDDFYRRLEGDPHLPTTSAVPLVEFARTFQQLKAQGATEIVALTINAAFSGAYQNAVNAASQVDIPVHVVDTHTTTGGLGLLVLAAARLRAAGASAAQIVARVEEIRCKLYLYVCLDTLEFVEKGGRIGKAARLVGTLLQIKPILDVDARSGEVIDIATTRTRKRSVEEFYRRFFQTVDPTRPFRIAVMHGNAPAEAAQLVERIRAEYHPLEIFTNITGPVLGINTGPRALALAGYNE
jgi:DegV family protein with EDD domain